MTFFFLFYCFCCQKKLKLHNQHEKKTRYKNEFVEIDIDNSISCNYCFYFNFCCYVISNKMNHSFKYNECFKTNTTYFYTF